RAGRAARVRDDITTSRRGRALTRSSGTVQVFVKIVFRIDQQHIAAAVEAVPIRIQAAHEAVKLRILAIGRRIDGGRLGVALALDTLGIAIGIGLENDLLAIGGGADEFGLLGTGRTILAGFAGAFGSHAVEHLLTDRLRQIDALD